MTAMSWQELRPFQLCQCMMYIKTGCGHRKMAEVKCRNNVQAAVNAAARTGAGHQQEAVHSFCAQSTCESQSASRRFLVHSVVCTRCLAFAACLLKSTQNRQRGTCTAADAMIQHLAMHAEILVKIKSASRGQPGAGSATHRKEACRQEEANRHIFSIPTFKQHLEWSSTP